MKKILSLLIVLVMVMSSFATLAGADFDENGVWYPANDKWDPISRDGVVARFAIGGDIHVNYYNSQQKLPATYDALKQIGGVDALMIAGDLTHYGVKDQYEDLMEMVNAYTASNENNPAATGDSVGTTILTMGNHEYWDHVFNGNAPAGDFLTNRFTESTGLDANKLYWVSGVPVIGLSPTGDTPARLEGTGFEIGNNYDGNFDFLKGAYDEIDASGYTGPIIVLAHHRTPTNGNENKYYSQEILDLMKAHPNTVIFTGHSHTWIENTGEFIVQDAGFTHVRAGSLGNNYGGIGTGSINPETGKPSDPLKVDGDMNCSCVLVDVLEDGKVKIRRLDIAKGKYMFPDEDFIVDPYDPTYYIYNRNDSGDYDEGTYGYGSQAPSFPADMKVTVEDAGNHSSIYVKFPEAIPATDLAKDFVSEYRIRLKDADGNILMNGTKKYFRVGNYRAPADEGKDWSVYISGLNWDTDYTVEVCAVSTYDKTTPWIACDTIINIGHGTATYPALPLVDFDYEDGSVKDQSGGNMLKNTVNVVEDSANGRKAAKFRAMSEDSFAYEFREEDFNKIRYSFTLECYFSAVNVNNTQVLIGGWDAARMGLRIEGGQVHLWANMLTLASNNVEDRLVVSADIEARKWYHVVAVSDGTTVKLYLNGELVDENANAKGGLENVPYEPEEGSSKEVVQYFCVGGANPAELDTVYPVAVNTMISKATLYEGAMKAEDVKAAYDEVTNPTEVKLPFTDVKAKSWFADAVKYVYKKELMNGKSDDKFVPNEATNRAMLVTILYRMEGSPEVSADVPFTDLKQAWYKDAVAWAYENEIVNGTSATTFDPNGAITRQQMAAILYRYNTFKGYKATERADLSSYPDSGRVQAYAKDAMSWANAVGLITGSESGGKVLLQPRGNATRAQVATILQRYDIKY